ncbi:type I-E CRISPR-associated protein Cas6/Cse3/CasE [Serratia microhaemolytica]|uniref:type I-E CRISPR-associated protein Cas6/Cse3/CasE n=1 Tax=Serratia microhaemolytica TaxID=2675110 RepID=UPI000FDDEE8B|nr:type I-E CRISPR-associated protein Cas6/Cse3/CasE [Serratia microhaemolytica]
MTLYVSAIRLDRAASKALKITDLYSLHRVVYSLFDDVRSQTQKQASEPSGIQWVDKGGDQYYRQLVILSDRPPQLGEHGIIETKVLPANFLSHTHYRFNVTLAATRRDNRSRKLIPIKGRSAIAQWFIERSAEQWGFVVEPQRLAVGEILVQRFQNKTQQTITLQQANLSGDFTVSDPQRFAQSFRRGVGRGRGFGCGLLQIVPVIEPSIF